MTRRKITESLGEESITTKDWPKVLVENLSESNKEIYLKRKMAVDMYLDNNKLLSEIENKTGIKPNDVRRLVKRCLSFDKKGSIYGYTALIPYKRIKQYTRKENSMGYVGAFSQLLDQYPDICEFIKNQYYSLNKNEINEPNIKVNTLHKKFLKKCIRLGIKETDYPFTTKDKGKRSLYRYINDLNNNHYRKYAKRYGEDAHQRLSSTGIGTVNNPLITRPYQQVQFDGHKIDVLISIKFKTTEGDVIIKPLSRIWLLAIIDTATRVILGYHLCLGTEYSAADVLKCIENSIVPKEKMKLKIKDLKYPENGGYASLCIPETQWAMWDEFLYDNAKANLAQNVIEKLTQITKCAVNAGPVATPERRGIVERFFGILEERGYHRLINTTGNNPKDPRRKNPEKSAMEYEITEDEIEELTEILIANYNNTPHNAIHGFTPLEVMSQRINRGQIPRVLSENERNEVIFLSINAVRTVSGNIKTGRRPYITYEGVEYRNDVLSRMPDLIGTKLTLLININDLRTIKAFLPDGSEFGILTAKGKWSVRPHSLKMRQEINKLRKDINLNISMYDDPIEIYHQHLINKSKENKPARNRLAILNKMQAQQAQSENKIDNDVVNNTKDGDNSKYTNKLTNSDNENIEKLKKSNMFKTFNL